MEVLSKVSVVLPSLDPDEKLLTVIEGLLNMGFDDIILVNDGSAPENLPYFEKACRFPQVRLLTHEQNRGKGAALKTAFSWFLENRQDRLGVITVDGDNQHAPEDCRRCAENMLRTAHLTLGVRDFSLPEVPPRSRLGNRITSWVFGLFVGMTVSDTQTGLRAIHKNDLQGLLEVAGDRFEYETNMLLHIHTQGIPFDEVKIRTVYIEENKSSHFRAVRDSWRIYKLILAHFFRYTGSSLLSSLVDAGLFTGLGWLLKGLLSGIALTAIPAVTARVVSSVLNFEMNRRLVFPSGGKPGKQLLRYFALAVVIGILQILLTYGACRLLGIGEDQPFANGLVYTAVMTALFVLSFLAQQRWVFAKEDKA